MINTKENKVLILSPLFPPEPVVSANLSYDIASALSERNMVTVLSSKPSRPFGFKFSSEALSFNFKHVQIDSFICASSSIIGRFKENYSYGKLSYKHIAYNHQNIDFIYANTWPLVGQYFAVKAARKYNIPVIIHVQDIYPESLSKKFPVAAFLINCLLIPLDKYILSHSTKVIAISEKMKKHLMFTRKLPADKIEVVRNWQDEGAFTDYGQNNFNKLFTFMYLGNISPTAGVDLLIHAFQKTGLKNAQLIIAGSGSDRKYCMKIAGEYENANILFIDAPPHLVPSIQSTANALILPLKKGIGLTASPSKLPAYMFSGKPIIACVDEDSDTAAVINEAKCGWVIQPENIEQLSALMVTIISEPREKMNKFGINGKNYAINNYSKKNNLRKLISIIIKTIPSRI